MGHKSGKGGQTEGKIDGCNHSKKTQPFLKTNAYVSLRHILKGVRRWSLK